MSDVRWAPCGHTAPLAVDSADDPIACPYCRIAELEAENERLRITQVRPGWVQTSEAAWIAICSRAEAAEKHNEILQERNEEAYKEVEEQIRKRQRAEAALREIGEIALEHSEICPEDRTLCEACKIEAILDKYEGARQ